MRIFDLAFKDISQIFRDKRSLLFLAAMPIAFTLFMGFAYRSGEEGSAQDSRMRLAWVEESPGSVLGEMLYTRLDLSDVLKPVPMQKTEALGALQKEDVDGVLVIPSAFGEQIQMGNVAQIMLIADAASPKGQSLYQLLRIPVSQLMSAVEIGRMNVDMLGDPAGFSAGVELAWQKWGENPSQNLVLMEQAAPQDSEDWFGDNPYNQSSPGILVQFAIMGLVTSAQILVQERKNRTLQRLRTTAMKAWEIVIGHLLGLLVIVLGQIALLIIFGQWVLDVNYLRQPVGTLLVSLSLGLWVSSMGLLIGLLAKGDDQVVLYSLIAMFGFSALGGAWFPLETTGGLFAAMGKALPTAWAMTGYQNILIRGLGLNSVWLPTGMLLIYALGFLALAVWRFRRMA